MISDFDKQMSIDRFFRSGAARWLPHPGSFRYALRAAHEAPRPPSLSSPAGEGSLPGARRRAALRFVRVIRNEATRVLAHGRRLDRPRTAP